MKIIHVEDYFDPTAGYQINELLLASSNFDDEVYLITSTDMSPFHKKLDVEKDIEFEKKTGVKIYRLETVLKISTRVILKGLEKIIEQIEPDLVYFHGIGDFKDLQLWRKKRKYKVVRDCHMSWVASKNKFNKIYFFLYNVFFATIINRTDKYDKIFALGSEEYEYLIKLGIDNSKIDFLKHGYNKSIIYYDACERSEIREKYKFKSEDIVISYIGKFNDFKEPDIILDMISDLDEVYIKKNNLKLLFIGPKEDIYFRKFNKKLNSIINKIDVVIDESKPYSQLRKYYSASDICIFPKETTLSSIHAQVCGCPVIMEKHQSNYERVIESKNLFEIDNRKEAVSILQEIIKEKTYIKNNIYIEKLSEREYSNQVNKLRNLLEK